MASTEYVDVTRDFFYTILMLAPEQSRAGRGWLDWSQEELAKRANVSLSTVRDFEKGRRMPISNNLQAIRMALEIAGVTAEFADDGQPLGIAAQRHKATGGRAVEPGTLPRTDGGVQRD